MFAAALHLCIYQYFGEPYLKGVNQGLRVSPELLIIYASTLVFSAKAF